jgi:Ca2+-transporting ATPase
VSGEGYGSEGAIADAGDLREVLLPAALCVDARIRDGELIGDPTEGALLALAAKAGLDAARCRSTCRGSPRFPSIRPPSSWPPSTTTASRCGCA